MADPRPRPPHGWCSRLAGIDQDAFGAVLRDVADRLRLSTPGLVEILHAREWENADDGSFWWLHVAIVLTGATADTEVPRAVDDAVTSAGRTFAGVVPIVHVYAAGAKALARYHRPPATAVAMKPPVSVVHTVPAVVKTPPKVVPPQAPPPPAPPKPKQQGMLF